jgi:hypothetical protein
MKETMRVVNKRCGIGMFRLRPLAVHNRPPALAAAAAKLVVVGVVVDMPKNVMIRRPISLRAAMVIAPCMLVSWLVLIIAAK